MKKFCTVVILTLISVLPAYAGKWSTGTTAPATCTVGDSWTDTNGTADNRFYTCTGTNTWTLNSNQTAIDTKANKTGTVMLWSEWGDGASFATSSPPVAYNGSLYKCIAPYTKVAGETPNTQTEYFTEVTGSGSGIAHAISDGAYYASRNGAWSNLAGVFLTPTGSAAGLTGFPSTLATDSEVTSAVATKANTSAFASAVAFEAAFGWAPGSGSISLSAEQDWTAVQNFNAGLTAGGVEIVLGSLSDIKFGAGNWVDDTKGSGDTNYLWSAGHTADQIATKQDVLVSGVHVKTINGNSMVGGGDLVISGGTGGYVEMTAAPYSDATCTTGQYGYFGSTAYLCTGGVWSSKWTLATHDNPTPIFRTLLISPVPTHGTVTITDSDLVTPIDCGSGTSACTSQVPDGAAITGITGTPDSGYELIALTGDIASGAVTMDADKTGSCTFGEASCTCTTAVSSTGGTTTKNIGRDVSVDTYGGIFYTPPANVSVCGFKVYPKGIVGTLTSQLYKARIFTLSGTTLATQLEVSDPISGSQSWNATTPMEFSFPSSVPLTAGTQYAIAITKDIGDGGSDIDIDSSNYVSLGYAEATEPNPRLGVWRSTYLETTSSNTLTIKVDVQTCE